LIGFAVVVVSVALMDVLDGRALFYTPSLLGQSVVGGFGEPTPGQILPGAVLAYNGITLLACLAVGMALSWLVWAVEVRPVFWYVAFFAALVLGLLSFLFVALVAEPLAQYVSRDVLVVATAFGAFAMALYMRWTHPRLLERIREAGDPEYGGL